MLSQYYQIRPFRIQKLRFLSFFSSGQFPQSRLFLPKPSFIAVSLQLFADRLSIPQTTVMLSDNILQSFSNAMSPKDCYPKTISLDGYHVFINVNHWLPSVILHLLTEPGMWTAVYQKPVYIHVSKVYTHFLLGVNVMHGMYPNIMLCYMLR